MAGGAGRDCAGPCGCRRTYDDGGVSGGTLDRPALQLLLGARSAPRALESGAAPHHIPCSRVGGWPEPGQVRAAPAAPRGCQAAAGLPPPPTMARMPPINASTIKTATKVPPRTAPATAQT